MIQNAIEEWDIERLDYLFIENVGNLVCPSSYDLGENLRLVLLPITEGEDKPLKYSTIFHSSDVAVIMKIIPVSSKTGHSMDEWLHVLHE